MTNILKTKLYFFLWNLHFKIADKLTAYLSKHEKGSILTSLADKIETYYIVEKYQLQKFGIYGMGQESLDELKSRYSNN